MDISWSEAFRIGGLGFGLVFTVLVLLASVIWISGRLIKRFLPPEAESESKKDSKY
jgi:Na+-transporting methylmalonyl-CoA/oxaloacetate decarboxylase gamma subunit